MFLHISFLYLNWNLNIRLHTEIKIRDSLKNAISCLKINTKDKTLLKFKICLNTHITYMPLHEISTYI